ncbi:AraC family transcriptional regulator [Paenibacillus sp. Lou8.1]|uniref:helix-turn-helix transcriptional regulator n=1 Tax=Paenibacillus sp. Lou8.1 TaxID=2962041 RepID=UPI0020B63E22|nr:AraC family transcriptional regulator [Paenibacillus sp. Lou8.1]MCP3809968.1 AraC family transcriptional regulator [Paenibacillus sp. Lou8.1]
MEYKYELVQADNHFPLKIIVHSSNEPAYIPRHWHDSIEISYVLSGKIDNIYIDGASYSSKEGDIVLINSNAIHSFSVAKGQGREAITVLIPSEFVNGSNPISFDCISIFETNEQRLQHFAELRDLLNTLFAAYLNQHNDPLAHIHLTSLSYKLVYLLLMHFKMDHESIRGFNSDKYLERLTLITDYIKKNYDQSLSLYSIAQVFGLSPEYLSRFFVKHVGMTLFQYINAIRLERSFRVLMNTDHSIIQIALEHGFPNEKSFARVFKKVYQATPHQYRKENKRYSGARSQ